MKCTLALYFNKIGEGIKAYNYKPFVFDFIGWEWWNNSLFVPVPASSISHREIYVMFSGDLEDYGNFQICDGTLSRRMKWNRS